MAAGCTAPNPLSCADGTCSDGEHVFCDVDGTLSGIPLTCVAVSCTPGALAGCRGEDAIVCNSTGDNYDLTPCEQGCIAEPEAHCAHLEPRYLPEVCDVAATSDELVIANSANFDTNLDTNCNGGVVAQVAGPEICVVRYRTIEIQPDITLSVSGSRVLALVADESLEINGILDVAATGNTDGPGGGFVISGGAESGSNAAGGAGFATAGGAGGNSSADGGAANGGAAAIDPALLTALVGGTRSATFIAPPELPNSGGGGGGATLISCRASVVVAGTIDAAGGGGKSGFNLANIASVGGCGGGAGGNVVLQGMNLSVTGQVFANGGGGGGGRPAGQQKGSNGLDGTRSTGGAAGGLSLGGGDGHGGNGGAVGVQPGPGARSTDAQASAGGGGGSVGFFQSYTPPGVTPTLSPSAASPGFQSHQEIMVR